jgi:hypothetical protein
LSAVSSDQSNSRFNHAPTAKLQEQLEATDKVVETQRELIAALQEEQAA